MYCKCSVLFLNRDNVAYKGKGKGIALSGLVDQAAAAGQDG